MNKLFAAGSKIAAPFYSGIKNPVKKDELNKIDESAFFESIDDTKMLESMEQTVSINTRSDAAAAVIGWVESGDSEADSFDAMGYGLVAGDAEELSDSQTDAYGKTLSVMTDFAMVCGASEKDCQGLVDGDDDAAERVFDAVETAINASDESELIADFAHREKLILEGVKKVIRGGQIVMIKTGKRKRVMNAVQKAALKKARLKSHSAAGRASMRKSMRIRKSRGL